MSKQFYGSYTIIPCKHDATPKEKLNAVRKGINRLILKGYGMDIVPDFDTMQFIIHETTRSKKSTDWYLTEKGQQIDDAEEVITVGMKFEADIQEAIDEKEKTQEGN